MKQQSLITQLTNKKAVDNGALWTDKQNRLKYKSPNYMHSVSMARHGVILSVQLCWMEYSQPQQTGE